MHLPYGRSKYWLCKVYDWTANGGCSLLSCSPVILKSPVRRKKRKLCKNLHTRHFSLFQVVLLSYQCMETQLCNGALLFCSCLKSSSWESKCWKQSRAITWENSALAFLKGCTFVRSMRITFSLYIPLNSQLISPEVEECHTILPLVALLFLGGNTCSSRGTC